MTTSGAIAGLLLGYSIAEIRQAKSALEDRENQLQSITQNVSDGIFRSTVGQGEEKPEIVYANEAFARMFGYDNPDALIGANPADFQAESSLQNTFFQSMKSGSSSRLTGAEVALQRKDGSTFTGLLNSTLIRDDDGEPKYRDGVVTDISEQKQQQAELREAIDEADAARKKAQAAREAAESARDDARHATRAKSQFLAGVAHDLRTPLTVILGSLKVLDETVDGNAATSSLDRIRRAVTQIQDLTEALDDLAKLQRGRFELETTATDVRDVVREALQPLRPVAEDAGIDLTLDVPDTATVAVVDAVSLRRVVDNLAGNAIKYGDDGDRVTVRLRRENGANHSSDASSGPVVLEVDDTGPGIDPDFRPQLFEPFARGDTDTSGTGLGLAVTKELVEAMGGRIAVDSTPGDGTCFTVRLPGTGDAAETDDASA